MDEVIEAIEKYQGLVPLVYDIETMGLAEARPQDMYYAVYLKREADKVIAHQKYKRCLMMAQEWRNYAAFCGMQSSCHNHRGFGKTAEKWTWKEFHAWKCVKRWREFAEELKEAK